MCCIMKCKCNDTSLCRCICRCICIYIYIAIISTTSCGDGYACHVVCCDDVAGSVCYHMYYGIMVWMYSNSMW